MKSKLLQVWELRHHPQVKEELSLYLHEGQRWLAVLLALVVVACACAFLFPPNS